MTEILQSPYFLAGFAALLAFGIERAFSAYRTPFARMKGQSLSDATREEQNAVLCVAVLIAAFLFYQHRAGSLERASPFGLFAAAVCGALGLVSIACAVTGWRTTRPARRAVAVVKAMATVVTPLLINS